MLLTKNFKYFSVPLFNETYVKLRPTDTINIQTLQQMKIVKEHGHWVAYTKRFDLSSDPLTLPFKSDEEEE